MDPEDGPAWRQILLNEFLWAFLAALLILGIAFHFATRSSTAEEPTNSERRPPADR